MNDDNISTTGWPDSDPAAVRELRMEIHCIEALMDWLKPSQTPLDVLNQYRLDEVLRRKRRALREVSRADCAQRGLPTGAPRASSTSAGTRALVKARRNATS